MCWCQDGIVFFPVENLAAEDSRTTITAVVSKLLCVAHLLLSAIAGVGVAACTVKQLSGELSLHRVLLQACNLRLWLFAASRHMCVSCVSATCACDQQRQLQ